MVLVTATRGELGEIPDGLLAPGETLAERRVVELAEACRILGVARQTYLGYLDSGMAGEDTNDRPGSFAAADVDEAAAALAAILAEEGGRRAGHLRRARRVRPPRPHPGPPGGHGGRRPGRDAGRLLRHHEPRLGAEALADLAVERRTGSRRREAPTGWTRWASRPAGSPPRST